MIKVFLNNTEYGIENKMSVFDFLKNVVQVDTTKILACKVFNEVKTLNFVIDRDCEVKPIDATSSDGNRIYVRGLVFIMLKAFEELYPNQKFIVNYSLGHSLYCESTADFVFTSEDIDKLKTRMEEIINADLPIEKQILTIEEAVNIYEKAGKSDKLGLLETRMKSHVSMYSCGDVFNYFYGVMPISTGYMKYFELVKYERGILLVYPRRFDPTKVEQIKDSKKLYATFDEYDKLNKVLGVENLASLNRMTKEGKSGEVIRISEALHEKKIANIADMIASDRKRRLVLIAGPSSSGKTTFAQRLGIQLKVNGIQTVTLSMDNYFVERSKTPRDENGNYDFECLEAIDLELFNEQLVALLNGEEVELPTFDFTDGTRKYLGNKAKLGENQVLVVEGIHGLNEKLTKAVPRENKFKIYISALTTLNIDDCNRISTSDTRLLRRMLRDSKYRSHGPAATIKMWESVRRGEEKYIFPFQEEADVMFNSSLVYEIAVLKPYIEPLLASVDYDSPEFSEAKRLYEFLGYFITIEDKEIPINSIMREFIGGGCFYR
ncbi:MAG: nucleoside kinase [Clostridia bacterium]|nr:nucleoside kinase [Clostridia bacterium]